LLAAVNFKTMDLNKDEILEQMRIEMPFHLPDRIRPYIEEAMQIYADQEAKAYASWLSNQVIAGRTATKLFNDYKAEIGTVA
jgi:hypothetical protein